MQPALLLSLTLKCPSNGLSVGRTRTDDGRGPLSPQLRGYKIQFDGPARSAVCEFDNWQAEHNRARKEVELSHHFEGKFDFAQLYWGLKITGLQGPVV